MSLLHKTPCHAQHTLCISLDSHIVLPHPASVGCIECRTGPWRRAKQGMHLWPVVYDCPCTYSFLHDFASICRNAPFYQNSYQLSIQPFRAESRIIPAPLALANSPTRFSWPMQVAWLHCERTRQNANDIQTMQFCDHLESPCLGAWSTSSSGTSLICLRTCRDEVRGAIRNLWKPLGFWNQVPQSLLSLLRKDSGAWLSCALKVSSSSRAAAGSSCLNRGVAGSCRPSRFPMANDRWSSW